MSFFFFCKVKHDTFYVLLSIIESQSLKIVFGIVVYLLVVS